MGGWVGLGSRMSSSASEKVNCFKNKTFKLCLRRLIILIAVFDIKLRRARKGEGDKRRHM